MDAVGIIGCVLDIFSLGSLLVAAMLVYQFSVSQEREGGLIKWKRGEGGRRRPLIAVVHKCKRYWFFTYRFWSVRVSFGRFRTSSSTDWRYSTRVSWLWTYSFNIGGKIWPPPLYIYKSSDGRFRIQSASFLISGILFFVLVAIFDSDVVPPAVVLLLL